MDRNFHVSLLESMGLFKRESKPETMDFYMFLPSSW